jgi:hypothetical protein
MPAFLVESRRNRTRTIFLSRWIREVSSQGAASPAAESCAHRRHLPIASPYRAQTSAVAVPRHAAFDIPAEGFVQAGALGSDASLLIVLRAGLVCLTAVAADRLFAQLADFQVRRTKMARAFGTLFPSRARAS